MTLDGLWFAHSRFLSTGSCVGPLRPGGLTAVRYKYGLMRNIKAGWIGGFALQSS